MKFKANQKLLDKAIRTVEGYTSKEGSTGSAKHQQLILAIADADSNSLRLTAENELSAIEYTINKDIEVEKSGTILVPAHRLQVSVSNVVGDEIEFSFSDLELQMKAGKRKLSLATLDHHSSILPRIDESGDAFAEFSGSDFIAGFKGGAAMYDSAESSISSNVYISIDNKKSTFVSRISTGVSYRRVPVKSKEKFEALVSRRLLSEIVGQISDEDKVALSVSGQLLHVNITGDKVNKHVSVALSAHDVSKFNFGTVYKTLCNVSKASTIFSVDKRALVNTFKAADTIASLNTKTEVRDIRVKVEKGTGIVISFDSHSGFEDVVEAKTIVGESAELNFRWNRFTDLFDSYPNAEQITIALVPNPDNSIQALVLIDDENFSQGDDPESLEYIAMAAASKNENR